MTTASIWLLTAPIEMIGNQGYGNRCPNHQNYLPYFHTTPTFLTEHWLFRPAFE
jgi:hypothetical protein